MQVIHQLQIGDGMLDFGTLKIALAAIDAIWNTGREQRMLNHARLRIRAIQDGNLAARAAFCDQAFCFFNDPLRFLQIAGGFINPDLFAMTGIGMQILAEALGIIRDQRVGNIENMSVRAIILLQLDQILDLELALERRHIADVGTAKGVNTLIVIADGKHCPLRTGHQLQPVVLQVVGILEFVDQNMFET